jgi:hypothetical protein
MVLWFLRLSLMLLLTALLAMLLMLTSNVPQRKCMRVFPLALLQLHR